MPQPQLDFVLDWMLSGGDGSRRTGGLKVPEADINTMNLLLGFVETLEIRPLVNRVRMVKRNMLWRIAGYERTASASQDKGTKFLVYSTGNLVETYVFGVRKLDVRWYSC